MRWKLSYNILRLCVIIRAILFIPMHSYSQNIDIEDTWKTIKAKDFVNVHGGASASLVYHNSNRADSGRLPWVYNLNGSLNITVLKNFNIPLSYNLTNMGGSYRYPTMPNRLSIHPTYKWVTGHIGDFTMSFSPYTFNGHMIRGVGTDLTIKNKIKISSFYGTLNQPVQYDASNMILPAAYKRIGYGLNLLYSNAKSVAGVSYFVGKDQETSIAKLDDSLRIYPKQNVALGFKGGHRFGNNFSLEGEYALSITTEDARISDDSKNALSPIHVNSSSDHRSAFRIRSSYTFFKKVIGLGYERVATGYQTMGAYYFNNDFENFTLDFTCSFFKGKTQFSAKGGLQQDNLDKSKASTTKRYIGSTQVTSPIGKKIQFTFNYSNFQNYMKVRNQFDKINQNLPAAIGDTLNYIQVNHNVNSSVTYLLKRTKEEVQNLLLNVTFQKSNNKQGGIEIPSAGITMYNGMLGYNINLIASRISITAACNTTYTLLTVSTFFYGPTISVNKRLLKDKLVVGFSTSYNRAESDNMLQSQIVNLRANAGFTYMKRHSLNTILLYQFRDHISKRTSDTDFTGTLTYAYNF